MSHFDFSNFLFELGLKLYHICSFFFFLILYYFCCYFESIVIRVIIHLNIEKSI